jgi:phosphotriesterase-related protein
VTVVVRTVLGDIAPSQLGVVDYHEHLFQSSPLLPGDDLDDEGASHAEARALRQSGASAMVEATPIGLGRRPTAVARIAAGTGLHIVHTTGAHREAHYAVDHPLRCSDPQTLHSLFRSELLTGLVEGGEIATTPDRLPVRAGLLKAAVGYWSIARFEREVLEAVGQTSAQTGAPVMVHLEHGSAAHEVLDILEATGCPSSRVALAHIDRNPDASLHLELAHRGAWLCYDGAARHYRWPDGLLVECMADVVRGGGGGRLLLGGDVARRSRYIAYGGMPGLAYLFSRFVPKVRARLGDVATQALLVTNPATWLAWQPPV